MMTQNTNIKGFPDGHLTRLVSRDAEYKFFKRELDIRRRKSAVSNSIFNVIGTTGIGKSTLLKSIHQVLLQETYQDVPWAMVDLDIQVKGDRYHSENDGPVRIIEDWIAELDKQSQTSATNCKKAIQAFYDCLYKSKKRGGKNDERETINQLHNYRKTVASAFVDYVNNIPKEENISSVILFIDTLEQASKSLVAWLEKEIVGPVTASGQTICIIASRQEVDWQSFDVRKRVNYRRIKPFDVAQVAEQLEPSYGYLASTIIKLSFGLPAANQVLAEEIKEISDVEKQIPDEKFIQDHRTRLVKQKLFKHLLYDKVMSQMQEEFKESLLALSPLRHFTVNIASRMLPKFTSAYQDITSGIETLTVIRDLISTTLIDWDREKRGYAMEDPLRQIFALVFEAKNPDKFLALHQEAVELYADLINLVNQDNDNRKDHLIEWTYHRAYVLHITNEVNISERIQADFKAYLEQFYSQADDPDLSAIDALYNQFQSDQVLQATLANISKDIFANLMNLIKTYYN